MTWGIAGVSIIFNIVFEITTFKCSGKYEKHS